MKIIGRKREISILQSTLKSNKPELVAVYGRRRVGKTYLIRNTYRQNILFEFSGIHKANLKSQLENFHLTMQSKGKNFPKPNSWIEAFFQLSQYIDKLKSKKKKVIFIDEFPWLDNRKSNFLPAFDNFWNSYASKKNDLVVVICGSAAAYMIKKIIRNVSSI